MQLYSPTSFSFNNTSSLSDSQVHDITRIYPQTHTDNKHHNKLHAVALTSQCSHFKSLKELEAQMATFERNP